MYIYNHYLWHLNYKCWNLPASSLVAQTNKSTQAAFANTLILNLFIVVKFESLSSRSDVSCNIPDCNSVWPFKNRSFINSWTSLVNGSGKSKVVI